MPPPSGFPFSHSSESSTDGDTDAENCHKHIKLTESKNHGSENEVWCYYYMSFVIGHPVALCWPADGTTVKKIIRYSYENSYWTFVHASSGLEAPRTWFMAQLLQPAGGAAKWCLAQKNQESPTTTVWLNFFCLSCLQRWLLHLLFPLCSSSLPSQWRQGQRRHDMRCRSVEKTSRHHQNILTDRYHQATITDPHPHLPLSCPHHLHLHRSHPLTQPDNHDNTS